MMSNLNTLARPPLIASSLLSLCLFIAFYNAASLSLLVTFDGHLYIDHARALFTERFPRDWDFLRTPLYPAYLKFAFFMGGYVPASVKALNTLLLSLGLCALWLSSGKATSAWTSSSIGMVLSVLCPAIVVYQVSALSELGTFFHLSLIILIFCYSRTWSRCWLRGLALGAVIAVGYYYRPTLLIAAVVLPFALLLDCPAGSERNRVNNRQHLVTALKSSFILILVSYLGALPWMRIPETQSRAQSQVWFAMVNQALIPPLDPVLGSSQTAYALAIQSSKSEGFVAIDGLPVSGVRDQYIYAIQGALAQSHPNQAQEIFNQQVQQSPLRYLEGVARSVLTVLSWPAPETDTYRFLAQVSGRIPVESLVDPGPAHLEAFTREHFSQQPAPSVIGNLLTKLVEPSRLVIVLGACSSLFLCAWALFRREGTLFLLCALPLAFVALHGFMLFGLDRMGSPAYPFFLNNLTLLFGLMCRRVFASNRSTISPTGSEART